MGEEWIAGVVLGTLTLVITVLGVLRASGCVTCRIADKKRKLRNLLEQLAEDVFVNARERFKRLFERVVEKDEELLSKLQEMEDEGDFEKGIEEWTDTLDRGNCSCWMSRVRDRLDCAESGLKICKVTAMPTSEEIFCGSGQSRVRNRGWSGPRRGAGWGGWRGAG